MKILARKKWGEGGQFDPTPWRPAEWGSFTLYGSGQRPDNKSCMKMFTRVKWGRGGQVGPTPWTSAVFGNFPSYGSGHCPDNISGMAILAMIKCGIAVSRNFPSYESRQRPDEGGVVNLTLPPDVLQCKEVFHYTDHDSALIINQAWKLQPCSWGKGEGLIWPYPHLLKSICSHILR